MKGLTISRSALRNVCKILMGSVKGRNAIQVLDYFLVSLDAEKGLCLRATDTVIDIKAYVDTETVGGEWQTCLLNMRMFTEIVDKFDGDEIVLEQKEKEVTFKSGGCKGKLVRLPPGEYPAEPDMSKVQTSFNISVDSFSMAVGQVEHAAARNDASRPLLERICIVPSMDSGAYVLALDGFRMERRSLTISESITEPILLDADKLSAVISALTAFGIDSADMACTGSWCAFETENVSIRLRRYDEKPINDTQLIKPFSEQDTVIRLRRKDFLDAAQRTLLFSEKTSSIVKVDIVENAVMVHASSKDGDIASTVDAIVNKRGKLDQIAFNSRYLIDCLRKGWPGSEEIDIGLTTNVSPMIVSGVGSAAFDISLVLPVRVYG